MASSIFILDAKGTPLISRTYRGDVTQNVPQVFVEEVIDAEEGDVRPVFQRDGCTYVFLRHNNIYFVLVSRINCMPAVSLVFMQRMVDVLQGYFAVVTEESIRDNFVIIYELLDEMMDFGYPQYTETKILKEYITQEGFRLQLFEDDQIDVKALPQAVTAANGQQWRRPGIKYSKNEVFLDVIESVNLLVGQDGETLHSDIQGLLKMRCYLSGVPDLKLGLNDKLLFEGTGKKTKGKTVELEDIKFHQCVKLNRFESDRTISFVPPDGDFDLMNYRLTTSVKPLIHVTVDVVRHGTSRVEMSLCAKSTYKKNSCANAVEIRIPVPTDAEQPNAKANYGSVRYAPEEEVLLWSMKSFFGGKEYNCKCSYSVPSVRASDPGAYSKKPIAVKFEIPYFTVSGFQVRYLKVTEKSGYEALPWVRYVTRSGDYQIRTS